MLAFARFLRAVFAADDVSESLITERRTLIAGYTNHQEQMLHLQLTLATSNK